MKGIIKGHDCNSDNVNIEDIVKENMPDKYTMDKVTDFFKIMGDGTRMKILCALIQSEMCVCDLAAIANVTKSAISHQLKALKEARLVKSRKSGRNVFYSFDDDHIKDIIEKALEHVTENR